MNRVLLLSPPFVKDYMRNARCDFVSLSRSQWYPIWLGYLGCFLEQHGYEVELIDAPSYALDRQASLARCAAWRPDFLVVYSGRLSEDNDVAFVEELARALDVPGVFVGPYASIDPQRLALKIAARANLARFARVVRGEFELPVLELLQGRQHEQIANLCYADGDTVKENPQRPKLDRQTLDSFPFLSDFFARHLDLRRYRTPSEHYPFIDIMTGRGCSWGHCTYCLWVHTFVTGACYNSRSPACVAEELLFIQNSLPAVRSVMLQDDTLTAARAQELSQAFLDARCRIPWSCYCRADLDIETMRLMKRAGCRNAHVGYESANPEILKRIKKGVSVERMTRFTAEAKQAGLHIHGDFAIGFPGETKASAQATIDWACKLRPHTAQFQLMIPFPGTPFHRELEEQGLLVAGMPNYPDASAEELEQLAKKAYRRYYLSGWFAWRVLTHPRELFFSRLGTYARAIPSIFWKKYVR